MPQGANERVMRTDFRSICIFSWHVYVRSIATYIVKTIAKKIFLYLIPQKKRIKSLDWQGNRFLKSIILEEVVDKKLPKRPPKSHNIVVFGSKKSHYFRL